MDLASLYHLGTMPQLPDIAVRTADTKRDRLAFLQVPFAIYRDDPNWVAPLFLERLEHLDPKKNPYFAHAEAQLFIAERGGLPVGRISAQIDRLRLERYRDQTGQFGFLEAPDDPAVFAALFGAAADWLKARGMKRVQGPFSFSINDETGLLIDGFDTPPSMMMGHAPRYYGARVEEQGFAKAKDLIAYDYDGAVELPRSMRITLVRAMGSSEIVIRPLDKKHLARDLDIVISIFNDAWSENWGFVPFTPEEIRALGNNLKMLVRNEYVAIALYRGEPAAMAVSLPNINEWIVGLKGRLLPFGWASLAWRLWARPPASVRMPLMGVRKKYHRTVVGSALALGVIDTVHRYHLSRGTTRGELSWILEDNLPTRRIIEAVGARPYKTYRVYEKALA
ncbi:MAG: dATP pyrophosphohydrolase [Hyphomicrobiales bacterium]